jgi:sigma-E factor negative regulatory protein RseA
MDGDDGEVVVYQRQQMMTNDEHDNHDNQESGLDQRRGLVSSLADGQLRGAEFTRAVRMVSDSGDARATWHAYHVVADVLRSSELAACAGDAAFLARFSVRLQRESTGLPPNHPAHVTSGSKLIADNLYPTRARGVNSVEMESANESRFRWKLLAGVASVAAVGAIGWGMVSGLGGAGGTPPLAPQLTQAPVQPQPQSQQLQVMIRDPHLDALLAAHKQFGGTSALQMPAGFLRNATFESPAR